MGLFFDDPKPRVTREEFKKVRSALSSKGFAKHEIDKVEAIFQGDINEEGVRHSGIDAEEIEKEVTWLRENLSKHRFSEEKISTIEEELKKRL